MRCGRCAPCRRWVESRAAGEPCEKTAEALEVRAVTRGREDRDWPPAPPLPERARQLEEALRGASAL